MDTVATLIIKKVQEGDTILRKGRKRGGQEDNIIAIQ
jgi:hypothetical protein